LLWADPFLFALRCDKQELLRPQTELSMSEAAAPAASSPAPSAAPAAAPPPPPAAAEKPAAAAAAPPTATPAAAAADAGDKSFKVSSEVQKQVAYCREFFALINKNCAANSSNLTKELTVKTTLGARRSLRCVACRASNPAQRTFATRRRCTVLVDVPL
jgi:hypothetical protein